MGLARLRRFRAMLQKRRQRESRNAGEAGLQKPSARVDTQQVATRWAEKWGDAAGCMLGSVAARTHVSIVPPRARFRNLKQLPR